MEHRETLAVFVLVQVARIKHSKPRNEVFIIFFAKARVSHSVLVPPPLSLGADW